MLRRSFAAAAALFLMAGAGSALAAPRSPFADDNRLKRPVTVRWKKETLYDALRFLARETGVDLESDRALVDEPVMASATRMPARVLLEQIGREFHYTWVRSGGKPGAPAYLLYQDRRSRQEEEEQLNGARRAVLDALNGELEKYRRFSKMPPDQVRQMLEKSDEELEQAVQGGLGALSSNPALSRRLMDGQALHSATSPVGRAMLELLSGLSTEQWTELQGENALIFSTRPEPGELTLAGGIADELRQGSPTLPVPRSLLKTMGPDVERGISQVEEMMREKWDRGGGFKVTVQLTLNAGAQPIGMLRVSPEPLDAGATAPVFAAAGLNLVGAPALFPVPKEDPAEREKRLAADPLLGKKAVVRLPPLDPERKQGFALLLGTAHRVADVLSHVEEAFGVHLVADAYNRLALSMVPRFGDQPVPLYQVLDTIAGITREWELDGDTVRFRSRTWAHDRRGEIPVRYMRRWLEIRTRKHGFALEDLADIAATLRDEQTDSLMYSALEAGSEDVADFVMIAAHRDILRFYGKLLPLQRRMLQQGQKLAVRELFPYQQKLLLNLNLNRGRGQSLFASLLGHTAKRTPQQIAAGTIGVTRSERPAPKAGEEAGPGLPAAAANIGTTYVIEIAYPDGKKDIYPIPLSRGIPANSPAAPQPPAVPPAAAPG